MLEFLEALSNNWEIITAAMFGIMAGADKVVLVLIKTMANIRDAWRDSFPKKYIIKEKDIKG